YRLLSHRFSNSPGAVQSQFRFDTLMANLGYDINFTSTDYSGGSYAALGNHLADNIIAFGFQDGANEQGNYANMHYSAFNPTLLPVLPGNPNMQDPNRWQPLTLQIYIDQSGNIYPLNTPPFLSPEWGEVHAFALDDTDLTVYNRDGYDYQVYHDPGTPPLMNEENVDEMAQIYQWSFELVAIWSAHLTAEDTTMWDISPASIGNIPSYPQTFQEHLSFYDLENGGDPGQGYAINPATGLPYEPQWVKRGDYTRVLAEFWADGPHSETPPGHWFTILNYVNDHPLLEKRFEGAGQELSDLEWDVKSYFALGGAVHDAAVSAWGVKGWYDYVRPISAIRYMADRGQSTDPNLPNFDPVGLPLVPGKVELVMEGDPLAGTNGQHIGKVKLYTWRGHDYINDPETEVAGVGWILAENWWPYQRPSFVTPPFAGYVSGHSTFSRAAAELLARFTGNEFFPGGMAEFHAPMNEFLVFEDGPSTDVTLQWAKYVDASDQCSLSRIWGGIHPTIDDIPGRLMGMEIGPDAFDLAKTYFEGNSVITSTASADAPIASLYPNPATTDRIHIRVSEPADRLHVTVFDALGKQCLQQSFVTTGSTNVLELPIGALSSGMYFVRLNNGTSVTGHHLMVSK
ncbi:MAG: T9SS type A sorting domain-containing protein, partial [Bacteroidetes bacterium]